MISWLRSLKNRSPGICSSKWTRKSSNRLSFIVCLAREAPLVWWLMILWVGLNALFQGISLLSQLKSLLSSHPWRVINNRYLNYQYQTFKYRTASRLEVTPSQLAPLLLLCQISLLIKQGPRLLSHPSLSQRTLRQTIKTPLLVNNITR